MDRNTLLNSSRAKFLSAFNAMIDGVVSRSIGKLYEKAEKSPNSQIQRQLLDARSMLSRNEKVLVHYIIRQLDGLLKRSYQTAYDTFRPSFFKATKSSPLALMDITAFEDDLRMDIITSRFRTESEEQLRDLNIRIAILFERNDIAERENPFRPYLLTRAIVLGVEEIEAEPELFVILTDQIAEELLLKVASLYEAVNEHLSECGVAAQLQFKSQRMPSDLTHPVGYDPESNAEDEASDATSGLSTQARQMSGSHARNFANPGGAGANQAQRPTGKIEQLINIVKSRNNPQGQFGGGGAGGGYAGSDQAPGPVGDLINQASSTVTGWLEGAQEVGDTLRRVFFGGSIGSQDAGDHGAAGGQGGYGASGSGLWQPGDVAHMIPISPQLSHALHTPIPSSTEMVGLDGEVRNLIIERRDNLNSLANDQHEKMTIDIVAMLFEFILKDHQVPAEVRAQLGRLQFSVLKMALMDSALLTKKSHPARLLVNRIGSISVGLQQIDPTGERISDEICRIVEELLASDSENPELFSKMLDQLDGFIARELLASNNKIEQAVKVVVNAEQRSQRLNKESAKLEKMLEGIMITPYLRRFLLDTWSHVIERVERNPNADSTRFRLLVPNLLWSILPKANRDDRSMLLQIIPIIVPVLREGMGLVAWLPEHQQELLNWLVDAHTTVMRAAISEEPVISLVEIQRHFHEFVYPDAEPLPAPKSADKVHVNRVFLDEAIKELERELHEVGVLQDLDLEPEFNDQNPQYDELDKTELDTDAPEYKAGSSSVYHTRDTGEEPETENGGTSFEDDILDRLRSGVVVEINLSGSPTKGRLNWISPNSSNLILTVNGQEAPSIISVRMFRRMLKNSRARFVEVAPLFERAVQSLLESADLVDLAHAA
ncbi:hypothetical protein AAKU67_002574 [Oxalobacteraceae bacterium GrIS 2.11]